MTTETPIQVLDLTPVGRYANGSPVFKGFHTSFPTRNVRAVGDELATPEEAFATARQVVADYEKADTYGNMGEALGVIELPGGKYRGVVNTYHSNT